MLTLTILIIFIVEDHILRPELRPEKYLTTPKLAKGCITHRGDPIFN